MDIRVILNEKDDYSICGHMHHAKSITFLCDCGGDQIVIENVDGSFEYYNTDPTSRMIRIEDINSGS